MTLPLLRLLPLAYVTPPARMLNIIRQGRVPIKSDISDHTDLRMVKTVVRGRGWKHREQHFWVPAWAYSLLYKSAHDHDVPFLSTGGTPRWGKKFWSETVALLRKCSVDDRERITWLALLNLTPFGISSNMDRAVEYAFRALTGRQRAIPTTMVLRGTTTGRHLP